MKKITLFSKLWRSLVGSREDESRSRLRVDYVSFTSRLRVWQVISSRMVAVFLLILTLSIGNAWGTVVSSTFTSQYAAVGTGEPTWTQSGATGFESSGDARGIAWNKTAGSLTNTSLSSNTIVQVVVDASANGTGSISVMVGSTSFTTTDALASGNKHKSLTFNGIATGNIVVSNTKGGNSIWIKSITVTYVSAGKYVVMYNGNDAESGSAPTDGTEYSSGGTVTVKGNTGTLAKLGHTFDGWNTAADGSGTSYAAGATFSISAITVLYAQWRNTYAGSKFDLVSDLNELGDGKRIIILSNSKDRALSRTQNSNNRGQVQYDAADNAGFEMSNYDETVTLASATTVQVITLHATTTEAGTSENVYELDVENGYLYAASSSNNYLRTQSSNNDNGKFLFASSDGVITITAQGTNTNNIIKYNSTNSFFSCYASGQKDIFVYLERTCDDLGAPASIDLSTKTAYTLTATWAKTSGGHETGYSVQLYDNNGSGAIGAAIGEPVAISGTDAANRTHTFGAKTPVGSRLEANHQYFVSVRATYSGDGDYCHRGPQIRGDQTTNQTYTVTYAAGTGGSGTMEDPITSYETGDEVSVLENDFYKNGYHFDGWTYSPAQSVTDGKFTMGSADVTITATWATNTDKFKDIMHGNTITNKTGNYGNMPAALGDEDPGSGCSGKHYKFMGWIEESGIGDDGKPNGTKPIIPAGESGHYATNTTYYAVWAAENE